MFLKQNKIKKAIQVNGANEIMCVGIGTVHVWAKVFRIQYTYLTLIILYSLLFSPFHSSCKRSISFWLVEKSVCSSIYHLPSSLCTALVCTSIHWRVCVFMKTNKALYIKKKNRLRVKHKEKLTTSTTP